MLEIESQFRSLEEEKPDDLLIRMKNDYDRYNKRFSAPLRLSSINDDEAEDFQFFSFVIQDKLELENQSDLNRPLQFEKVGKSLYQSETSK